MSTEEQIRIVIGQPGADLSPVKRFWYDVYVTEMGRHVESANHERRELDDPRAASGILIVAQADDRVVGTLICTASTSGNLGEYESFYEMSALGAIHPTSTAIVTKLMVTPEYRHTSLSVRIACELYRLAVPMGLHHAIIDCNDHLLPMFQRLGFTQWREPAQHPDYGRVNILKLDCLDMAHLERVQSPLVPIARRTIPKLLSTQQGAYA
ncbi:MAG: GNAT family N-acetyltransferase [Pseudomonadota bacterium]